MTGCSPQATEKVNTPALDADTVADLPRVDVLLPYILVHTKDGWGFRDAPFEQATPSLYATLWSALLLGDSLTSEQREVTEQVLASAQGDDGAFHDPNSLPPISATWLALFARKELHLSGGDHLAVCRFLADETSVRSPTLINTASDLMRVADSLQWANCEPELGMQVRKAVMDRMSSPHLFDSGNPAGGRGDELLLARALKALGATPTDLPTQLRERAVTWMKAFPETLVGLDAVTTAALWYSFQEAAGWYDLSISPPLPLLEQVKPNRYETGSYRFQPESVVMEPQLTFQIIKSGLEREPNLDGIRREVLLYYMPKKGWSKYMDGRVSARATYWAVTMAGLTADEAKSRRIDLVTPCHTQDSWELVFYCIKLGESGKSDLRELPIERLREAFFFVAVHKQLGIEVPETQRQRVLDISSSLTIQSAEDLFRTTYIDLTMSRGDQSLVASRLEEFESGSAFSFLRQRRTPDLVGTYFALKTAALVGKAVSVPSNASQGFLNDRGLVGQPDGTASLGTAYMGFVIDICASDLNNPICLRAD